MSKHNIIHKVTNAEGATKIMNGQEQMEAIIHTNNMLSHILKKNKCKHLPES